MEKYEVEVVLKASDGSEYAVTDGAVIGRVEGAEIVVALGDGRMVFTFGVLPDFQ